MHQVDLNKNQQLFVQTQPGTDALNTKNEPFSDERLVEKATQSTGAAEILSNIIGGLESHIGDREQYDDITLLALQ